VSSHTRETLVAAAMRLFATKGYAGTTIADILHTTGVNAGSLYYFFPGKQDLLIAVLDAYRAGIGPMLLEPAWRRIDDPIERIFALLARYRLALQSTDCTYGCPIGSLALEIHEPDPAVRERLAANFTAWIEAIERCLVEAGSRVPPQFDRRALATFVLTTMEGGVMLSRTDRSLDAFDQAVAVLRAVLDPTHKPSRRRAARARTPGAATPRAASPATRVKRLDD
jgi:TetR/AcrR family transcriptional repressor of nem operon